MLGQHLGTGTVRRMQDGPSKKWEPDAHCLIPQYPESLLFFVITHVSAQVRFAACAAFQHAQTWCLVLALKG